MNYAVPLNLEVLLSKHMATDDEFSNKLGAVSVRRAGRDRRGKLPHWAIKKKKILYFKKRERYFGVSDLAQFGSYPS